MIGGESLFNTYQFVGLQGKPPVWVVEYIFYGGLDIVASVIYGRGAWLEEVVHRGMAVGNLLHILAEKHNFQLVDALERNRDRTGVSPLGEHVTQSTSSGSALEPLVSTWI